MISFLLIYKDFKLNNKVKEVKKLTKTSMSISILDEKLRQAGKELKKEIARDVKSIQDCAECFENWVHDNFAYFVQVCNTPHLLVLAKFGGFRYWPAKVMSVAGDKVTVEFFGDHSQADVPQENCYLYRKPKLTTDALFNAAVKVNFSDSFFHLFSFLFYSVRFKFTLNETNSNSI